MTHIGNNTSSSIIAKSISSGNSKNTYRSSVNILPNSEKSKNYTQCDSLLITKRSVTITIPTITISNNSSKIEHEARTSKISEDQLKYCNFRCINNEIALSLIINGFC